MLIYSIENTYKHTHINIYINKYTIHIYIYTHCITVRMGLCAAVRCHCSKQIRFLLTALGFQDPANAVRRHGHDDVL